MITSNVQSFCANKTTVKTLLEKRDIILQKETLLSSFSVNEQDGLMQNNEISCHTPANLNTRLIGGRPSGGLTIIWKIKDNISCFPVFLTEMIMSLVLKTALLKYALLNVYLTQKQSTAQYLQDYKSSLGDLTKCINDGCFDEIIVMGDFNCEPNKDRFFRELQFMTNRHSLLCCDVDAFPFSKCTYMSQNQSGTCSWIDHILSSKK